MLKSMMAKIGIDAAQVNTLPDASENEVCELLAGLLQ